MSSQVRNVVIFGTGSFAQVLHFYLDVDSDYRVVAFTATTEIGAGDTFCGKPLVPFGKVSQLFPPEDHSMFVAVGYRKLNRVRAEYYHEARSLGYDLITYVSSKAIHWADTMIGDNCCILEGTTIEPFVSIGNDVVFWSGSHIGHHSSVDDHCFLASDVVIPGHTRIGRNCFIGVNATLRDGITVGDGCLIGAGATLMGDTNPGEVFLGPRSEAYGGDAHRFLA